MTDSAALLPLLMIVRAHQSLAEALIALCGAEEELSCRMLLLFYLAHRLHRLPDIHRNPPCSNTFALRCSQLNTSNDRWYREEFRMSRATFNALAEKIRPCFEAFKKRRGRPRSLELEISLAIFLYRMATTLDVRHIANKYGVEKAVIVRTSLTIARMIVVRMEAESIKWPRTLQEFQHAADEFEQDQKKAWPNCFGALDGCHIRVKTADDNFYCRKKFHSMNCMFVANGKGRFMYADIGTEGKHHDAYVLESSPLSQQPSYSIPPPFFVIADCGYPYRLPWLRRPFNDKQLERSGPNACELRLKYNADIHSARCVIERAFGRLKGRWARLRHLDCKLKNAELFISAGAILHNWCEEKDEQYAETEDDMRVVRSDDAEDEYVE